MATNQGWEKWFWRDWKSDPAVRRLTAASRAIWFEILGDMWLQETDTWTGSLLDLEQAANATSEDVEFFLSEIDETGVCDKNEHVTNCHKHVTLTSRRKHKEQKARENAKLRQRRARAKKSGHVLSQGEGESESESEKRNPPSEGKEKTRSTRGTRLPNDWQPPPEYLTWARENGNGLDLSLEADKFRDYWIAQPGQKGVKVNWNATWRNWIRNARGRSHAENGRDTGRRLSAPERVERAIAERNRRRGHVFEGEIE